MVETTVATIRQRPGMYCGNTDGTGVMNLVLDLLANAHDQYLAGRCTRIGIAIEADGTTTVEDDGPGLPAHGGRGLPPLEHLLTRHSTQPTVDGHRPHAHHGLGGLGLFVVNALSERLEVVTVHAGVEARVACVRGAIVEPLAVIPTQRPSGTTVRFRADRTIFRHGRAARIALTRHLEDLAFLSPGLALSWEFAGDDLARHGLAGLVALSADCDLAAVAHASEQCETTRGPLAIEVALAWSEHVFHGRTKARIDSFVNLQRTRAGSHVDGLLDGVVGFGAPTHRTVVHGHLVAAVSVILADVTFGSPMRDRLATPEVRAPVANATKRALEARAAARR